MREIKLDELRLLQIGILDTVVEFCNENGISYWLDCGTLLGAIRHNGYIPWDDDIDIAMLRPDFERFIHLFNGYNNRYSVRSYDIDNTFDFAYAKVNDNNTILYEPDENGIKMSVNIDIFVYDKAPENDKELKKAFRKKQIYRNCNQLRTIHNKPKGNILRRTFIRFLRLVLLPFPRNHFVKKLSLLAQKYKTEDTNRIANFTYLYHSYCDKNMFDSFIVHEFEGKNYKIPCKYDEWLKILYGDYMSLPPKEKRNSHHPFKAYYID